jgi:hypothetical protein
VLLKEVQESVVAVHSLLFWSVDSNLGTQWVNFFTRPKSSLMMARIVPKGRSCVVVSSQTVTHLSVSMAAAICKLATM